MKQHGRKSAAAVAAMMVLDGGFGSAKVVPPEGMPERQAKIWKQTVKGEPPELFKTAATRDMLADYCQQRAQAEEMNDLINEFKPEWLAEVKGMRRYEWLSKMRRMAMKQSMELATKLRLTNQSRWQPAAAASAAENEGGEDSPWTEAKSA